jgi:flagellar motor protein MotB
MNKDHGGMMKRYYYKVILILIIIIGSINLLQAEKAPKVKDSQIIQQQREEINRMTEMQAQEVDMIKSILLEKRDDLKRKIGLFREDMALKYKAEFLPEEERIMYYKFQKELATSKISLAKTNQLLNAFGITDDQSIAENSVDTAELPAKPTRPTVAKTTETAPTSEPKSQVVEKQPATQQANTSFFQLTGNVTKFHENVLFGSGSIELDENAKNVLNYFIQDFANYEGDYMVQIIGHTDNLPIGGRLAKKYASNWNLSVMRSIVVAEYLIKVGNIDPRRLIVSGQGEYNPINSNSTAEERKNNRRVELMTGSK